MKYIIEKVIIRVRMVIREIFVNYRNMRFKFIVRIFLEYFVCWVGLMFSGKLIDFG